MTPVLRDILRLLPCLIEYILKLHFLHSTVSDVPVTYISSTCACRLLISLAESISVLPNMEIWLCRKHQRCSANEVSMSPLRSSGTVYRAICVRPPSPKDSFGVDWMKPASSSDHDVARSTPDSFTLVSQPWASCTHTTKLASSSIILYWPNAVDAVLLGR